MDQYVRKCAVHRRAGTYIACIGIVTFVVWLIILMSYSGDYIGPDALLANLIGAMCTFLVLSAPIYIYARARCRKRS